MAAVQEPELTTPAPEGPGAQAAAPGAAPAAAAGPAGDGAGGRGGGPGASGGRKNKIQVSNTKKPLYFYINLSKKFLQSYGEVELSGLGAAIATVATIAEILKNSGLAEEKRVNTSTLVVSESAQQGGGPPLKVKIEVVLKKTPQFEELMDLAAAEAAVAPPENGHYA